MNLTTTSNSLYQLKYFRLNANSKKYLTWDCWGESLGLVNVLLLPWLVTPNIRITDETSLQHFHTNDKAVLKRLAQETLSVRSSTVFHGCVDEQCTSSQNATFYNFFYIIKWIFPFYIDSPGGCVRKTVPSPKMNFHFRPFVVMIKKLKNRKANGLTQAPGLHILFWISFTFFFIN